MSSKLSIALAALFAAGAYGLPAPASADPQEGMVVVRDRTTGQFRNATPAEVKALRAQQTQRTLAPAAPSPVTLRKDGSRHKHLGENAMVYSVVKPRCRRQARHAMREWRRRRQRRARTSRATQPGHDHEQR